MTQSATSPAQACVFCAIASRQAEASVVHQDEVGLEDLDGTTGAHVWPVAHEMARALRRSSVRCEGINLLLCDGGAAFQTVFHPHVIPRYVGDGWNSVPDASEDRPPRPTLGERPRGG